MPSIPVTEKKRAFDVYPTIVEKIDNLTPRNKGFTFRLLGEKDMPYKSGQFVQVYVPVVGGEVKRRSYSIASVPRSAREFELVVTLVEGGIASPKLHEIPEGTELKIMGPLGHFVLPELPPRDIVFISVGSGIAPFRSMIGTLLDKKFRGRIYLLFGNRFDDDVIYKSEWDDLKAAHPNFDAMYVLSRPTDKWPGKKGYVQDFIQEFLPDPAGKDFYICGLNKMITDVQTRLLSLQVPPDQIHFERYD